VIVSYVNAIQKSFDKINGIKNDNSPNQFDFYRINFGLIYFYSQSEQSVGRVSGTIWVLGSLSGHFLRGRNGYINRLFTYSQRGFPLSHNCDGRL
jgi:hypothetical protein